MKKPTPKPTPKGKDWTEAPSSVDFGKKFGEYQRQQSSSNPLPVGKGAAKTRALAALSSKLKAKKNMLPASPTK